MKVVVLRIGHRYVRDDRVTTHVFLAARALGARKVIYSGQRDKKLEESVRKVVKMWGGSFEVSHRRDWRRTIAKWKELGGEVVHLTVYGQPIHNVIPEIRECAKNKLVIVGGAKVPRIVYELADWNVSITSQPHSEISALSIFLHELFGGKELSKNFKGYKIRVEPHSKGKTVFRLQE